MARYRKSKSKSTKTETKGGNNATERTTGSETNGTNTGSVSNKDGEQPSESASTNSYRRDGNNDPEWYKQDPQLYADVARLNFSDPMGSALAMDQSGSWTAKINSAYVDGKLQLGKTNAIPGILSVRVKPAFGRSWEISDPLNVCANAFYTHVRYVNSGRKNYDPADLMLYTLAIAELYSYVMWAQRLYGYAFMYSQRNNYIGADLIWANKVDASNIVNNLANFRAWLNTFINKVSSFAVPGTIALFKRRAFMYASLYTESTTTNIKDQLYQFVPDGFYRFTLDTTSKGMLKYERFQDIYGANVLGLQEIINYGELLLSQVYADEDFGLMSGDIIKAYGTDTIALGAVPDEYYILPVYEEFVLSQIRNATVVDTLRGTAATTYKEDENSTEEFTSGDIMQNSHGNLVYNEFVNSLYSNAHLMNNRILTVTNPTPSEDDVMEASRLMVCKGGSNLRNYYMKDISDSTHKIYMTPLLCGSDIVTELIITQHKWINNIWTSERRVIADQMVGDTSQVSLARQYFALHMFHWAPCIFIFNDTVDSNGTHVIDELTPVSNLDNYTVLAAYTVQKLHEVALLSLVYVPGVAKMVNFAQ